MVNDAMQVPTTGQSNFSATRASRVMDTITKVALAVLVAGAIAAVFMPLEAVVITAVVVGVALTPVFYACFPRPLFFPRTVRFSTPFFIPTRIIRGVGFRRRPPITRHTGGRSGVRRGPVTPPKPDRFRTAGKTRRPPGAAGRHLPTRRPPTKPLVSATRVPVGTGRR